MEKKALLLCISALSALVLVIAGAVYFLYSETDDKELTDAELVSKALSARPLLGAVPSDAAMLFYGDDLSESLKCLSEIPDLVPDFFSGTGLSSFRAFRDELCSLAEEGAIGRLRKYDVALSLHYEGTFSPLMQIDISRESGDSTVAISVVRDLSDSLGLSCSVINCDEESPVKRIIAVSPSESLVKSATRHVHGQASVLVKRECATLAGENPGTDMILVDNTYSGRLAAAFIGKSARKYSGFVKAFASWSGLYISGHSKDHVRVSAILSTDTDSRAYYGSLLESSEAGTSDALGLIPDDAAFAVVKPLQEPEKYIEAYRRYADANGNIDKYDTAIQNLKRDFGVSSGHWIATLGIREIAVAGLRLGSGSVLMIRGDKVSDKTTDTSFPHEKYASALFGGVFVPGDTVRTVYGNWILIGNKEALTAVSAASEDKETLLSKAASRSLPESYVSMCKAIAYVSAEEGSEAFAIVGEDGISADILAHVPDSSGQSVSSGDSVTVKVPSGPFKVMNCATKRTNLLYSDGKGHLSLKEENGKGLWTVPFKGSIAGVVVEVDYFSNGKIQFLFASGDRLCLIDRLGRYVRPYPLTLPKPALLGPSLQGKTLFILHPDNTVGAYDMSGKPVKSWKGLSVSGKIMSLPEPLNLQGRSFWTVRTDAATIVFPQDGGSPLTKEKGGRAISPEATLSVKDGVLNAVCNDGRERNFKL